MAPSSANNSAIKNNLVRQFLDDMLNDEDPTRGPNIAAVAAPKPTALTASAGAPAETLALATPRQLRLRQHIAMLLLRQLSHRMSRRRRQSWWPRLPQAKRADSRTPPCMSSPETKRHRRA